MVLLFPARVFLRVESVTRLRVLGVVDVRVLSSNGDNFGQLPRLHSDERLASF